MAENISKEDKDKALSQDAVMRSFCSSDIGKVFWRVEYKGVLTECTISKVLENGKGVIKLRGLNDFSKKGYNLNENKIEKYNATSEYNFLAKNIDISQFYFNYEEAKKASYDRYLKEVNPFGKYRVARYFDDIFECFRSEELTKEEAEQKANEYNKSQRCYVSYRAISV